MMVRPFLLEAERERVRVELTMKRGGRWRSVPMEENGERARSAVEGRRRCGKLWGGGSLL
jgi:hypothetical protein